MEELYTCGIEQIKKKKKKDSVSIPPALLSGRGRVEECLEWIQYYYILVHRNTALLSSHRGAVKIKSGPLWF